MKSRKGSESSSAESEQETQVTFLQIETSRGTGVQSVVVKARGCVRFSFEERNLYLYL